MPLEFHWIGATGNSLDKYDWNSQNNWLVYDSTAANTISGPWSRASRTPEAADTVKIGEKFHCFSPLLFGGYTGGTGASATSSCGTWGNGASAGVTDGGIQLQIVTDALASDWGPSVAAMLMVSPISGQVRSPSSTWGAFEGGVLDLVEALQSANPHHSAFAATGSATIDEYSGELQAKYPFPYLGGGLTGAVLSWAYNQHRLSYNAHAAVGSPAFASANAWVGGGFTGAVTGRALGWSPVGVRVRHKNFTITPGQGMTPLNQYREFNVGLVADKEKLGGTVDSKLTLSQSENILHNYTFKNGTLRSARFEGDSNVNLEGTTAASINSDLHTSLSVNSTCSVGGLMVEFVGYKHRYNVWPLYFAGSITSGASNAVWGQYASTIPVPPMANKIVLQPPQAMIVEAAKPGFVATSSLDPYMGIGQYQGGTSSYAVIPTITVNNTTDIAGTRSPKWSVQLVGSAKIAEMNLNGGSFAPSLLLSASPTPCEAIIGSINMAQSASVRMNVNPEFDNLYFGGVTGTNPNNYRLIGGINTLDDTCVVYPSSGIRMINTKIIGGAQDSRGGLYGIFASTNQADRPFQLLQIPPSAQQID